MPLSRQSFPLCDGLDRREIAAEIADIGDEFVGAEELILNYIRTPGQKQLSRFDELRQEFQQVVAKLRKRVSRQSQPV